MTPPAMTPAITPARMTGGTRFFEDYPPGLVVTGGPVLVSEAEILEFARRYDPQPMHTDPASAQAAPFGGLIASGWHTAALTMRLVATEFLSPESGLASPGIDELRWLKPVRPGDALSLRATVTEARPSRSKPDQGVVRSLVEVLNQHGEVVMTLKPVSLIRRRPAGPLP
jgi:acyl dehydratase